MIATVAQPEVPRPRGDPLEYLSPSRLKTYLSCPLRFFFEKVVQIQKPVSPSLHLGRAVHAALQAYNKARWRGNDCSEPAVLTAYHDAFQLEEPGQPVAWESEAKRGEVEARGALVLSAFLQSGIHPASDKPAGVEVTLEAQRPELPLPLLGIVDLVKADGTPVDYKTVGSTPDLDLEGWLHELQLVAYTLLVEDATNEPIPGCELVFLVKTKTPKVIVHRLSTPDEVQVARFRALVLAYVRGVEHGDYHPTPGPQCAWCSYRQECSKWQGVVP